MKNIHCIESYPVVMTVADIAEFMEKSIQTVYFLIEQKEFPSIKLGGRILIYKLHFKLWLDRKSA